MSNIDIPSIPEWLRDRSIFITGATGFVGKVLVEKLLRSCPNVSEIFLLVRKRKGLTGEERVNVMLQSVLYEKLRSSDPNIFKKLKVINGDVSQPGLGISAEDKKLLQEKGSVVFHAAASTRFDDSLTKATLMNTKSTKEVIELSRGMKNLEVIVHVSTAFTNCDRQQICEDVYPPRTDWKKVIKAVEVMNEHELDVVTPKLINEVPNTYIFTKSLAEDIVYEERDRLPVVILRPSIVVFAIKEPIPGWLDNINSFSGLIASVSKGVLHVYLGYENLELQLIAVDVLANSLIVSAWYRSVYVRYHCIKEPDIVFNATSEKIPPRELYEFQKRIKDTQPMMDTLWESFHFSTVNNTVYLLLSILFHFIPGLLVDGILKLAGGKARLTRLYRLIYVSCSNLKLFTTKKINFVTDKFDRLNSYLLPVDKSTFSMSRVQDRDEIFRICYTGMRMYLFNEPREISDKALSQRRRTYWIDRIFRLLLVIFIYWLLPLQSMFIQLSEVLDNNLFKQIL